MENISPEITVRAMQIFNNNARQLANTFSEYDQLVVNFALFDKHFDAEETAAMRRNGRLRNAEFKEMCEVEAVSSVGKIREHFILFCCGPITKAEVLDAAEMGYYYPKHSGFRMSILNASVGNDIEVADILQNFRFSTPRPKIDSVKIALDKLTCARKDIEAASARRPTKRSERYSKLVSTISRLDVADPHSFVILHKPIDDTGTFKFLKLNALFLEQNSGYDREKEIDGYSGTGKVRDEDGIFKTFRVVGPDVVKMVSQKDEEKMFESFASLVNAYTGHPGVQVGCFHRLYMIRENSSAPVTLADVLSV